MKYSLATTVLATIALNAQLTNGFSTKSAFTPRVSFAVPKPLNAFALHNKNSAFTFSSTPSLSMLLQSSGGMLELEEWLETDPSSNNGVAKTVRKSPYLWRLASYAAIPASAALGFAATAPVAGAVAAAGAVATGVAGFIGRNKLSHYVSTEAAKPAIAACLIENGLQDPKYTAQKMTALREQYDVHPDDFRALCGEVYRKYLVGMVKFDSKPRTSELTELEQLKEALLLDNLAVGEAHMLAASDWFRSACLFKTEEDLEDEDSVERQTMNKILYLTERALRQNGETEGAFLYELTRTAKVFNLTYYEALERVEEVVEPFYERALKSARNKLGTDQVSATMLERARATLGVSPQMGFDLHESALNDEVRSLLGDASNDDESGQSTFDPKTAKFPEGTMERLEQLRQILSLAPDDVEYEITSAAMPLFRVTALDAMTDAIEGKISPEEAWNIMDQRRDALLIPAEKSDELVSTVVVNALGKPLEEVKKFFDVNNEQAVYESMLEVLKAKDVVEQVLKFAGWTEDFYDSFCNPMRRQSVNLMFDEAERPKVFELFVKRSILKNEGGKLTDEADALIAQVKGILAINDIVAESQSTKNFGPKLYAVMERAMREIMEDFTPELAETLKVEINQVIDDFKISDRMIGQNGRALYQQALNIIQAKAPAGVPTKEQNESLRALEELFMLERKEVTPMHLTTFGSVYRKSLEEAMSITGIIRPEYRGPLSDLRERLGISSQQARELFLSAVKKRMIPMVEWIVSEMERTVFTQQQLSQRKQKDLGEDYFQSGKQAEGTLGLGAEINVLGDIMNLVDFYMENEIAEQQQIGTQKIEKTIEENGEKKIVVDEVPIFETFYPITALETGAVDQKMAEVLFRQFVVGSFTTQGPNAVRYEKSRATFGGILGLSSKEMEDISSTIGETVYDNYVGQSLRTKGTLDQQDMMFLANLQTKLGLTPEQGEAMLKNSQQKILMDELEDVMSSPAPTAVREFREKINSMGLSLTKDVGVTLGRLTRMFEIEISPGLESGEITPDSGEVLAEIQESLGLSEDDAGRALENMILQKCDRDFGKIAKDIRRGRVSEIVEPLNRLVRLGKFLNGQLGIEIEEKIGRQIFNTYENFDFEGMTADEIETNKELLKTILSLS